MDENKYWLALDPARPGTAKLFNDGTRADAESTGTSGNAFGFKSYESLVEGLRRTDQLKDLKEILLVTPSGMCVKYSREEFPETPLPPEAAVDKVLTGAAGSPQVNVNIHHDQENPEGLVTVSGGSTQPADVPAGRPAPEAESAMVRLARTVRRRGGGIADFLAVAEILEA